jgi:hypothetical protein
LGEDWDTFSSCKRLIKLAKVALVRSKVWVVSVSSFHDNAFDKELKQILCVSQRYNFPVKDTKKHTQTSVLSIPSKNYGGITLLQMN